MTTQFQSEDFDRSPALSQTAWALQELQLYGTRAFQDEVDLRPMPEPERLIDAVSDIFDALAATLGDTRMEPELEELLWGQVNLFHRAAARTERLLDDNEVAQHRLQREQDGSEVKSVQLETLIDIGQGLIDRRESMELFRETAADLFLKATGTHWSPRSGSRTSHRHLTAAMIDSRDFIAAKKRAETESLVPPGPKVAFSGGDTTDHRLIWDRLDQIHAKHPDMVLLHGGSPKGAERIAATWASNRKVPQVAFKPDWTKHSRSAPFKRNDQMLDCMPIGVVVFPGTGIQDNLADKARKMGIPVYRMATGSA